MTKKKRKSKPTTGQSAPKRALAWDQLSNHERRVLGILGRAQNGAGKPQAVSIQHVAHLARKTDSWFRNTVRRLVPSGWVTHTGPGTYRLSTAGRKRPR